MCVCVCVHVVHLCVIFMRNAVAADKVNVFHMDYWRIAVRRRRRLSGSLSLLGDFMQSLGKIAH